MPTVSLSMSHITMPTKSARLRLVSYVDIAQWDMMGTESPVPELVVTLTRAGPQLVAKKIVTGLRSAMSVRSGCVGTDGRVSQSNAQNGNVMKA